MLKFIELNEIAYTDRNAASAWEKLKNKYETAAAPSMVKLDKQFRDSQDG